METSSQSNILTSSQGIVLGFGSNQGDRVRNLTQAFRLLIERQIIQAPIRVSSVYVSEALTPENSPESWKKEFLNFVLEAKSSLDAAELVKAFKEIESELGRDSSQRWSPRVIDIDLLFYKNQKIDLPNLQVPHAEIFNRNFVLKPLHELFPGHHEFEKNLSGSCEKTPLKVLPSQLVGILNLTPDSFSDGGRFSAESAAKAQVDHLIASGASVIDIGAESTRPGAKTLSVEQEWERLSKRLEGLKDQLPSWVSWSVDSRKPEVMQKALEFGVSYLNDVSSAEDKRSLKLWVSTELPIIFMHHMGIPADRTRHLDLDCDPVQEIKSWAAQKIKTFTEAGVSKERLIFDPGIGFGKTALQSLEILSRLSEFKDLGLPVYVGHSRKSFLHLVTDRGFSDRDLESAVFSSTLFRHSDFLRVHKPEAHQRAILSALLLDHLL